MENTYKFAVNLEITIKQDELNAPNAGAAYDMLNAVIVSIANKMHEQVAGVEIRVPEDGIELLAE